MQLEEYTVFDILCRYVSPVITLLRVYPSNYIKFLSMNVMCDKILSDASEVSFFLHGMGGYL